MGRSSDEIFANLLKAYERYYNIVRDGCISGFDATGFLSNEAEQYFLVRSARTAFIRSYEYVYFKKCESLGTDELKNLDRMAWEDGMAHVRPSAEHKNTDVALIIVADRVSQDVKDSIVSYKHSRNYKLGFFGFSNYRLVVMESLTGTLLTNRRGRDHKDFYAQIIK